MAAMFLKHLFCQDQDTTNPQHCHLHPHCQISPPSCRCQVYPGASPLGCMGSTPSFARCLFGTPQVPPHFNILALMVLAFPHIIPAPSCTSIIVASPCTQIFVATPLPRTISTTAFPPPCHCLGLPKVLKHQVASAPIHLLSEICIDVISGIWYFFYLRSEFYLIHKFC